ADQLFCDRAALIRFQIERHRLLPSIDGEEVGADAVDEGRAQAARFVAAARLFDLDDARAGVGEHLGAERSGEDAREIGDENAFERPLHRYCCFRASRSARVRRRMLTTLWISEP